MRAHGGQKMFSGWGEHGLGRPGRPALAAWERATASPEVLMRPRRRRAALLGGLLLGAAFWGAAPVLRAQSSRPPAGLAPSPGDPAPPEHFLVAGQSTLILQNQWPFRSPYAGPNSLQSRRESELSQTYTLFLGARLTGNADIYLYPEVAAGTGVGNGAGLGGYPNGDLIGTPPQARAYLAGAFVRLRTSLGRRQTPGLQIGRSRHLVGQLVPARRLALTVGQFSPVNALDANAYANDARTQFMNYAFINNLAYDYAQNVDGYSRGVMVDGIAPGGAVRVGIFQMPRAAGGADLATDRAASRSDQIEVELHPVVGLRLPAPAVVRLLAYRNKADMGRFREALATGRGAGQVPDVTVVRRRGAIKYGFGLNFEQPLADGGATGLFGRFGWNDGATEDFCYAACDRTASLGGQLSGARWRRAQDVVGLAVAQNDLSAAHRDYLTAGGLGLRLGDGALHYGSERIAETYYSYQVSAPLALTLDYQYLQNPGYNQARGPVSVLSFRLHAEF